MGLYCSLSIARCSSVARWRSIIATCSLTALPCSRHQSKSQVPYRDILQQVLGPHGVVQLPRNTRDWRSRPLLSSSLAEITKKSLPSYARHGQTDETPLVRVTSDEHARVSSPSRILRLRCQ